MQEKKTGILYVVATPMGHLQDITLRALEVLRTVDWIAAEDTRHSRGLLSHYNITARLLPLHAHNESTMSQELIQRLQEGASIALISDAGTPLISDPGFALVRSAQTRGISVSPIPGACAAIAALSVAGLPVDEFTFMGFLPAKSAARQARLTAMCRDTRTLVCYEAPHRLLSTLQDAIATLGGDRRAVVARELTKTFETVHRGTLTELLDFFQQNSDRLRGEMVLLLAGFTPSQENTFSAETEKVLTILLQELPLNQAVKLTALITGEKKNRLYQFAVDRL